MKTEYSIVHARRRLVTLVAILCLSLAACTSNAYRGTVVDQQGKALPGIQVSLCGPRDEATGQRANLGQATTNTDGRFAIHLNGELPELLTLGGSDGVGRMRLDPAMPIPEITYPVRTTIILLHDNDLHFNFNHIAQFTSAIEETRKLNRNVFLLNGGDIFIRHREKWNVQTNEFYASNARTMIAHMNRLGYDAMVYGNHEMDYINGYTRDALVEANFPLLAANIKSTTDLLPQPAPYAILTTDNDLTIAVMGLATAVAKLGVHMRDPIEVARENASLAEKHDVFVALTHIGHTTDKKLAEAVACLDVIIGGHSHTNLEKAIMVNGVLIAQTGGTAANSSAPVDPKRPKFLGRITLTLDNGRIVEKHGEVVVFGAEASSSGVRTSGNGVEVRTVLPLEWRGQISQHDRW
ncbi:MAG TPA: metallophosphoesterase [Candidatus Brocadiia bacterium]|nr:metallophosphoesterase [Candidatus Brocadiia bacterium]